MSKDFDIDNKLAHVESSAVKAAKELKGLYTFEGHRYWPEDVHAQKVYAILTQTRAWVDDVNKAADQAEAEADTLDAALYVDPLATVDTGTLTRMTTLAPFVKEELETMPMITLANRLRGVITHGDEATQRAYLRYAQVQDQQNGADKVRALLEQLDEKVNGARRAALAKDTTRAQELRSKAIWARMKAADVLGELDGSKAAAWEKRKQQYGVM